MLRQAIFNYFWFLCIPIGLLVTRQVWTELTEITRDKWVEQDAAARFIRVVAGLYTIPPLLLGTIQLMGGYQSPGYPSALGNEPFAFAGWLVMIGLSLFLMAWFWLGNAAEVVSAFRHRKSWIPANLVIIKLYFTTIAMLNIVFATFLLPFE